MRIRIRIRISKSDKEAGPAASSGDEVEVASASGAGASGAGASAPPPESDAVSKDLPIKKRNRNSEKLLLLKEWGFVHYFIQHYLCNDHDCSQTGRYRMLRMFRKISDVLRYKKCDSNIAMRGCSAPAQKNLFSRSTMQFHLISPL